MIDSVFKKEAELYKSGATVYSAFEAFGSTRRRSMSRRRMNLAGL